MIDSIKEYVSDIIFVHICPTITACSQYLSYWLYLACDHLKSNHRHVDLGVQCSRRKGRTMTCAGGPV